MKLSDLKSYSPERPLIEYVVGRFNGIEDHIRREKEMARD